MEELHDPQQMNSEPIPSADTPLSDRPIASDSASESSQVIVQTPSESPKKPMKDVDSRVAGVLFVILGVTVFVAQYYGFRLGNYIWPMFILVPGMLLFIVSLKVEGGLGESFAIVGSIITMLGLMFFVMSITGLWASWAYAWALLFPTSIGIGQILYGRLKEQPSLTKTGWSLLKVGVGIFLVGFLFFEGILNISGLFFGMFGLPLFFIAIGVFLLMRTMRKK